MPRLLTLFRELDILTTWLTSDHDLSDFTDVVDHILDEGHEVALYRCCPDTPQREHALLETLRANPTTNE